MRLSQKGSFFLKRYDIRKLLRNLTAVRQVFITSLIPPEPDLVKILYLSLLFECLHSDQSPAHSTEVLGIKWYETEGENAKKPRIQMNRRFLVLSVTVVCTAY